MAYNNDDRRKNNRNNSGAKKKTNTIVKLPLYIKGVCGEREYAVGSLKDLLAKLEEEGIFSCISIPVYMYRDDVTGKPVKGTTQVGYIRSIDDETVEASVFASYTETLNNMDSPMVYPRCIVRENEVVSIIGLDICEATRYE